MATIAHASAQSLPRNLVVHAARKPVPEIAFENATGRVTTLTAFADKALVLNIWATWCVPCRREMPALDRLQATLGGPHFAVVPVSIDRGGVDAVMKFYGEIGIQNLPIYLDVSGKAARAVGAIGLPTTLVLDREGYEIARVTGPAEWDAPELVEFLKPLVEQRSVTIQRTDRGASGVSSTVSAPGGAFARGIQWVRSLFANN
ncbi:TlpA family protein disulfide reductase [Bradyrhizobium sp.]|uniref:TlpA family protein disulfide reductase n=1 Tax=Bradyrhizobium sp. TaxID=376 RepID=UPI004037AA62